MSVPQPFHVHFKRHRTGEEGDVGGEFPNDEWALLLQFAQYADDLRALDVIRNGIEVEVTLHIDAGGTISSDGTLPPADAVCALLHRLRPFVLERETTYFKKICDVLKRRLDNFELRGRIDHQNDLIKDEQSRITDMQTNLQNELTQADAAIATLQAQKTYYADLFQAEYNNNGSGG